MSIEPHMLQQTHLQVQGLRGSTRMKLFNKTKDILSNESGETMVEVLVAFTLLSIMLVIFAQGITWASKSEVNAITSRTAADQAMRKLCSELAGHDITDVSSGEDPVGTYNVGTGKISCYEYTVVVEGEAFTYEVFEPEPTPTPTPAGG